MYKQRILLLTILAAIVVLIPGAETLLAEGTAEPGPHAANFKLLNNSSGIDDYTGGLNWKYELLTVPGRSGLDFPISLTYHSGIGCEQEASWVGLGWGLNLGSIERSVVFVPDDMVLYLTYGANPPNGILQLDGWLFDDNWNASQEYMLQSSWEKGWTDGPDMWTVALNEAGMNLSIVADSTNISYDATVARSAAGYEDWYEAGYPGLAQFSDYGRYQGLVVGFLSGGEYEPYEPHLYDAAPMNERQRICYVSPPMDTTVAYRYYGYAGTLCLGFNDNKNDFNDNSGGCSVYVYKLPADSTDWETYGPFYVDASETDWTNTEVEIDSGDRFGVFTQTRKFVPENWTAWTIDYEIEFTDWGGYYTNPEDFSNPWEIWNGGYTPRVRSFKLTSPQGMIYRFEKSDYIKATSFKYNGSWMLTDSMSVCFDYSYKLTSILSNDYVDSDSNGIPSDGDCGSWIRIVYDGTPTVINYANKSLKALDAIFHRFGEYCCYDAPVWQWHHVHYPQYIETPTHKAEFHLSSRDDNLGFYGSTAPISMRPKQLDSLALYAKSPSGNVLVRKQIFGYADCTVKPESELWAEGDVLGWHEYPFNDYSTSGWDSDSIGKLTLLSVTEKDSQNNALPALEFSYDFNPRYEEQIYDGQPNDNVDYFESGYPYSLYNQNWGYFKASESLAPADTQRAWSLSEIIYPLGAVETMDWESNSYCWADEIDDLPPGVGIIEYKPEFIQGSYSAKRGGVRLKRRRLDGGHGNDSAYVHSYGEGVVTKPQAHSNKTIRTGYIGNSQEVGYRSSETRLEGQSENVTTKTFFTNGSSTRVVDTNGHPPQPAVSLEETFRDWLWSTNPDSSGLNGVKRGLPYKSLVIDSDGDTLVKSETSYGFETRASLLVDRQNVSTLDIHARSIWVKRAEESQYVYDENGENPVLYATTYDYDTANGLVTWQEDLLQGDVTRVLQTEYLHTQDPALENILAQKNMLTLVYSEEVLEGIQSEYQTVSRTSYDYKDFGDDRIYLWHRYDHRDVYSDSLTTTYAAYDQYGNPTLTIDPNGIKTTRRWGYNGSRLVLEAPNADTSEVTYNGFEDSLTFDSWNIHSSTLSSERCYSGRYSAKVDHGAQRDASYGPSRLFADAALVAGRYYVFSGWVYTDGAARLMVDRQGIPGVAGSLSSVVTPGSWQRVEKVFLYPEEATGLECYTAVDSGTAYFDDLRIHPHDCPMQTYAYDRATGQLQATFDANNVSGGRYYYDGFGLLAEIRNPGDTTMATYTYYHSRSESEVFDTLNPNYVYTISYRSWPDDSTVACVFYDGLGREIQRQTSVSVDDPYVSDEIVATFYDHSGLVAAVTKPITLEREMEYPGDYVNTIVPDGWEVGNVLSSGDLHEYYDASGPGPDCHGYPFYQNIYSDDPFRRIKEIGSPDTTWRTGSGRTVRAAYMTNSAGDVGGWNAGQLVKNQRMDEGGLVGYEYTDPLGRLVQTQVDSTDENHKRFKTWFDYDIRGNLTRSIRQRSETDTDTTVFEYDPLSQIVYMASADGGGTSYLYDKNLNLRFYIDSVRASEDEFVYYKYDALNRRIEEGIATGASSFTQANADQANLPTSSYEIEFSFSYDSLDLDYSRGRLCSWSEPGNRYGRQLKYDGLGRVTEEKVEVNRIPTSLSYTYDLQSNLKSFTTGTNPVFPSIKYDYNYANRLEHVGIQLDGDCFASLTYWPGGSIKQRVVKNYGLGGGACQTVDYAYNPRGWLLSINDTSDVTSSMSGTDDHFSELIGYMSSMNGDIDSIVTKHSGEDSFVETFQYDRLRRLMRWHGGTDPDTAKDEIFHYDRAGNVTYWKRYAYGTGQTHTYYPGTNRLKRSDAGAPSDFIYDLNGNLLQEPGRGFDQEYRNIVSKISVPQADWTNKIYLTYDADLQRVKKSYLYGYRCECGGPPGGHGKSSTGGGSSDGHSGGDEDSERGVGTLDSRGPGGDCICYNTISTLYVYTHDGRLVREYVEGAVQRDYLYAGGDLLGVKEKITEPEVHYYLNYFIKDHLGSTRQTIDTAGLVTSEYDYYPYGTVRRSYLSLDTKIRFTGKHFDDDGGDIAQHYFGARYMNGQTLRFNSIDPIAGKYPGWSPYVYALCSPVRYVDPNGTEVFIEGADAKDAADIAEAAKAAAELNKGTSLDLTYDKKTGEVSAKGKAISAADKKLLEAINDQNIKVHLKASKGAEVMSLDGSLQWMIVGIYDGSTKNVKGEINTSQFINLDQAKGWEDVGGGSVGQSVLHEINESYIGAVQNPGKGYSLNTYNKAHKAATAIDPKQGKVIPMGTKIDAQGRMHVTFIGPKGQKRTVVVKR